jgi:hypothetical protein
MYGCAGRCWSFYGEDVFVGVCLDIWMYVYHAKLAALTKASDESLCLSGQLTCYFCVGFFPSTLRQYAGVC